MFGAIILSISFRVIGQQKDQIAVKKVKIDQGILVTILNDYIDDANENRAFYEDKGVIRLKVCQSGTENATKYSLMVFIDDRYEDLPIEKYGYFGNFVVLMDSCRSNNKISNKEEYFRAMNEEIGDRVYKRPSKKVAG